MKQGSRNYISVKEAAQLLGVSVQWVRFLILKGQFKGVLRGVQRSYWIPEEEIKANLSKIPGRERLIRKEA